MTKIQLMVPHRGGGGGGGGRGGLGTRLGASNPFDRFTRQICGA